VSQAGVVGHSMVEFGDSVIGSARRAPTARSAQDGRYRESLHQRVHRRHRCTYQRALAASAQIAHAPHDHRTDYRAYEALDLEGHRWRFIQWLREVPIH